MWVQAELWEYLVPFQSTIFRLSLTWALGAPESTLSLPESAPKTLTGLSLEETVTSLAQKLQADPALAYRPVLCVACCHGLA
jgi:hypothetical protein